MERAPNPTEREISVESPLGAALMFHEVEDTIEFYTPGGVKIEVKITSIV